MINIIKKEIKISKELLSKIEWACAFNKTTLQIFNGNLRIIKHTNLAYVEPEWRKIERVGHKNEAEAMLKVIMNKMNGTLEEVITKKAEEKIKKELSERIPEPKEVKKQRQLQ